MVDSGKVSGGIQPTLLSKERLNSWRGFGAV